MSQQGQDYWVINEVFHGKRNGYFVEIGSADGISINNTYLLEKVYGWTGICVEPNPEYFALLQKVRTATCFNVCVDRDFGKVEFVLDKLHGGILESHHYNQSVSGQTRALAERTISLEAIPLVDLLKQANAPRVIDYLSIDVEGAETRILGDFPFDEYQFTCMTVELPSPELQEVLQTNGYLCVKVVPGLDHFYIHRSFIKNYHSNAYNFYTRNTLGDRLNHWFRLLTN
ncbi:FkbM family methyltransferase [Pannus brasiliensis]|uniref:FkbM family methyltransferase n=1 Tax=Pannus brasiliensis TaxID=1579216 RepID=UPI002FCD9CEE